MKFLPKKDEKAVLLFTLYAGSAALVSNYYIVRLVLADGAGAVLGPGFWVAVFQGIIWPIQLVLFLLT